MKLYSHNGSYPQILPQRIRLSNGKTRTDSSTYTEQEIVDAGWIEAPTKPTFEYPNKLDWQPEAHDWLIRTPYEHETAMQWQSIRKECIRRLDETDYKIIKAMETGIAVNTMIISYRQQIRDIYNNINNINPWFIEWPAIVVTVE